MAKCYRGIAAGCDVISVGGFLRSSPDRADTGSIGRPIYDDSGDR
jgi:hypothetical protein